MFVIVRELGYSSEILAFTQDESQAEEAVRFNPEWSYEKIEPMTGLYDGFKVSWVKGEANSIMPCKTLTGEKILSDFPGIKSAIVSTRERAQELLEEWSKCS